MTKRFYVKELLSYFAATDQVIGNVDKVIDNIADRDNINSSSLDWIHGSNLDPWEYLISSKANVIIAPNSLLSKQDEIPETKTVVFSENPMLLFTRIANTLFVDRPSPGIHPSAVIDPEAIIGKNVYIGPFCYIGKCRIGDDCVIHSHVSIEDDVAISDNVLMKNGARIGQPGFGFVKNENGEYEKFPQVGKVIIRANVEIGANSCIDRGALSNTVIGKGTKIDSQVHVAHNVEIGENCVITGRVSIAGSVTTGDNVWIGPGAIINNGLRIGSKVLISMGSVVTNNVKDNEDIIGYPAESKILFVKKRNALYKIYKERNKDG